MSDTRSDVYVVTASDGTFFRCHIERVGGTHEAAQDRWIFVRYDGTRFVGPAAMLARTADELRELVDAWWRDRKGSGYADATAEAMRARLAAEGK